MGATVHRVSPCLLLVIPALAVMASLPTACESMEPEPEGSGMTFALTSPAFGNNERIPVQYTGEGKDVSPPLEWGEPPPGTKTFALVCDDPDAPVGTWDHWLIWNLPGNLRKLPEGVARRELLAELGGAAQGMNSWPKLGYNGPMPPKGHGTHHYNFVIYALDTNLPLGAGANKKTLLSDIKGHVLAQGKLTGIYSR
ncbi:MAG: YbhB/YbcL family Raf kinase inhibitor-like protein [Planctomycetota bacterium]|nr:YbhB/YbcL family Raf kinase inhibitor-like protein [Planctomycetota bacterium]